MMTDPLLDAALASIAALAARDLGDPMKAQRAAKLCQAIDYVRRLFATRVGEVARAPRRGGYVMQGGGFINNGLDIDDGIADEIMGDDAAQGIGRALVRAGGPLHNRPEMDIIRELIANAGPLVAGARAKMADDARKRRLGELRALREALADLGDATEAVDAQIRALGEEIVKQNGGPDGDAKRAAVVCAEFPGGRAAGGGGDGEGAEDAPPRDAGDAGGEAGAGDASEVRAQEEVGGDLA